MRSLANMCAHFAGTHQFHIVTRNRDYCAREPYRDIVPDRWTDMTDGVRVFYAASTSGLVRVLNDSVRDTSFDWVYINGVYSLFYSILPLWRARWSGRRVLVAPRGMLNPQAFTSKALKKRGYLGLMHLVCGYRGGVFHATNREEAAHIRSRVGSTALVRVAPNLPRRFAALGGWVHPPKEPGIARLISVARISPEKGTLHALKLLSALPAGRQVSLDIFGPVYDPLYWEECQRVIDNLPAHVGVQYKGAVDGENVPSLLAAYHFLIMLTEGENFGHAILEALGCGCPVIISDRTPWRSLTEQSAGWDFPLGDEARGISALTQALDLSEMEYIRWSESAQRLAADFGSDPGLVKANSELFE